jgi:hypothetical protein
MGHCFHWCGCALLRRLHLVDLASDNKLCLCIPRWLHHRKVTMEPAIHARSNPITTMTLSAWAIYMELCLNTEHRSTHAAGALDCFQSWAGGRR